MTKENVILVGNKDFLTYMRSLELLFRKKNKKEVVLIARGQNIKKAVDLAEASKNKFLEDLKLSIKDVKISTTNFKDKEDIMRSVSCIEITLNSN